MSDTVSLKEWTEERILRAEAAAKAASSELLVQIKDGAHAVEILALNLKEKEAHNGILYADVRKQAEAAALTLEKQAGTFARATELQSAVDSLRREIAPLAESSSKASGRQSLTHPIVMLLVGAAIAYLATSLLKGGP